MILQNSCQFADSEIKLVCHCKQRAMNSEYQLDGGPCCKIQESSLCRSNLFVKEKNTRKLGKSLV